jgi:hypothetical protein
MLMRQLHPSDARLEHAQEIMTEALHCADLSRQLLAFSRRQVLNLRVVDLREVVRRMESLLRGTLREDVRLQVWFRRSRAGEGRRGATRAGTAESRGERAGSMSQGGTLKIEIATSGWTTRGRRAK